MSPVPRSNRRRTFGWIGVSLALHAALFLWLRREAPPPHAERPPITVTLVTHDKPPPAPVAAPAAPARTRSAKASAPQTPVAVANVEATPLIAANPDHTPPAPEAPRAVTLLPPGALMHLGPSSDAGGHTSHVDPNIKDPAVELARVQRRLDADNEAFQVRLDTQTGARGTLVPLKHALIDNFLPPAKLVQSIPGSAEARDQKLHNMLDAHNRPQATAEMNRNMSPSAQAISPGGVFDGCSASHEIGRLEARFRVEHDDTGKAIHCALMASSGQEAFDTYALKQLQDAMSRPQSADAREAVPKYSEWVLSQVVYDWLSTAAYGCPPLTHPPGRPVNPDAGNPYAITFTTDITLAAVRYRHDH